MNKSQTSQAIKYESATLKMPHVRKPLSLFGLHDMTDNQINSIWSEMKAIYDDANDNNTKQLILDIVDKHLDMSFLFSDVIANRGATTGGGAAYYKLAKGATKYMLEIAEKAADQPNATMREINSFRRLDIIDRVLHFGWCFGVLSGSITNDHGFNLLKSDYKIQK